MTKLIVDDVAMPKGGHIQRGKVDVKCGHCCRLNHSA